MKAHKPTPEQKARLHALHDEITAKMVEAAKNVPGCKADEVITTVAFLLYQLIVNTGRNPRDSWDVILDACEGQYRSNLN